MIDAKFRTFGNRFFAGLMDGLIFFPVPILGDYLLSKKSISLLWVDLAQAVIWLLYVVIGHAKYGQTVGKWLMNIKVLDLGENKLIGYRRAFYRESVWFLVSFAAIFYMIIRIGPANINDPDNIKGYESFSLIFSLGWFVAELVTMLTNNKRRAIHDFIAGSVVVNLRQGKK